MSLPAFLNGLRALLNLTLSESPQWVRARRELEEGVNFGFVEPFMVGYNATPEQKAQWKAERVARWRRVRILLLVGAVSIGATALWVVLFPR